jgi:acetyl-CoA C-acetyltransferase
LSDQQHPSSGDIPVLAGCGQLTDKRPADAVATPIDLMAAALRHAADDAGPGSRLLQAADVLVAVGMTADSTEGRAMGLPCYANVPASVARALGIQPARSYYTATGGNTPQLLVNRFAEAIARGDCDIVLITGAESLDGMLQRFKLGLDLEGWQSSGDPAPELITTERAPVTDHEAAHGIQLPAAVYPLFENALRGARGEDLETHRRRIGELFHPFTRVAAQNPLAWFPTERSARELVTPTPENRLVGFPYTKYLNAVINVNMGAALILTSARRAREMGIAEDRLVYLHGCAEANDRWYLHERADYSSSPAIRSIGKQALAMAGRRIEDMDHLDIYSCFPSAVQIACRELGIPPDDPRSLTVTGGLPYFGGPGNNYATHAIASMMQTLRSQPGSYGLVNANGWFITKHAIGIYSTDPVAGPWHRTDPEQYREQALGPEPPPFTETPQGKATVETYTVICGRKGPERGLVIGRTADGTRFVANTPDDADTLGRMLEEDMLDCRGTVVSREGLNLFTPASGLRHSGDGLNGAA